MSSATAAPSDLGGQGRESVKIQVNTRSPSLHPQATKDTSVGLLSPLRCPRGLCTNSDSRVAAVFVPWAVQPCGGV